MSDAAVRGVWPGNREFRPSLDWLIDPTSKQQFFQEYWEARPLVVKRRQQDYFASLLSLDEVDRALTTLDRKYPDVVLKDARREVTAKDYATGSALDIAGVYQLFAGGSTITLAFLDTVLPSLALFCRSLESELSFPMQANIYLTPPGAQGAKPHYDTHDVFVLQIAGSKKWTIYGTPVELPLPGQDFDASIHAIGPPALEFELEAGDVAYIPRGVAHDAHSTETVSLHITAGVLRYTWADLLLEVVAEASLGNPAFRKSLPPGFARQGFDRAPARETLRNLLERVRESADLDAALDGFVDEFVASCPPLLRGQMAQMQLLDQLTVHSVVGARAGGIFRLLENEQTLSIDCCGRRITLPLYARDAAQFALTTPNFQISELPGPLDDAGKVTLIRRLIREGLVVASQGE